MEIESRSYKPKSGGSGYREAPADELQPIHHGPTSFEIELAEHEPIGIVVDCFLISMFNLCYTKVAAILILAFLCSKMVARCISLGASVDGSSRVYEISSFGWRLVSINS